MKYALIRAGMEILDDSYARLPLVHDMRAGGGPGASFGREAAGVPGQADEPPPAQKSQEPPGGAQSSADKVAKTDAANGHMQP